MQSLQPPDKQVLCKVEDESFLYLSSDLKNVLEPSEFINAIWRSVLQKIKDQLTKPKVPRIC